MAKQVTSQLQTVFQVRQCLLALLESLEAMSPVEPISEQELSVEVDHVVGGHEGIFELRFSAGPNCVGPSLPPNAYPPVSTDSTCADSK